MANEKMREYWSSTGAVGWVAHKEIFDAELASFADAVLAAVQPGPGDRLLDVGCGTGTLTEQAVARGASAVGVDISPAMVDAASALVPAASFLVADAQTEPLDGAGPFTAVMSRFGVMFFDDPEAAFANVRRAVAPDGRLAFVCWRGRDENPMFTLGTRILLERLDPPPPSAVDGVPGPVAFADADRIRSILDASGWGDVSVEPFDAMCDYGRDGSDGVEARLTMILGTSVGSQARAQIEPEIGEAAWAELLDDVRAELRRHLVDGRLQFNGATWLVTARNPA